MGALRPYDDLQGVDLSQLDLSDIELDIEQAPSPVWRWVFATALLSVAGVILYLPTTDYYHAMGSTTWVFFALSAGGTIVGVSLGRWLWGTLQTWADRYAARLATQPRPSHARRMLPPAVVRWLTLLVVLGGSGFILFGVPSQDIGPSRQGTNLWVLAALGAVVVGILLGRWLMMQASAARNGAPLRLTIRLPAWFKWVTLTMLLIGSIVALIGTRIFDDGDTGSVQFGLGTVGFAVGLFGAIWIARRFDETEQRLQARARERRRRA